jgi:hypothetical protein
LAAVLALWVLAMALCSALVVAPSIGWGALVICISAAMAEQVIGMAACVSFNANEVKASNARLKLQLSRCGVTIHES